jgi:hypothetical protein
MATNCERDSFSSASLLLSVDYRCFRPSSPFLQAELQSGAESTPFNAALQFKRPVTCTTELPTLPTAAELECIGKTFKWDLFQLIAAGCILKGESVLVCAHTSSGKTVVGEFAVARALAAGQRILLDVTRAFSKHHVTSFSCTLRPSRRFLTRSSGSSVKPSDLRRFDAAPRQRQARAPTAFVQVGLLTGDVTVNRAAPFLVMTTEIYRSMLCATTPLLRTPYFAYIWPFTIL